MDPHERKVKTIYEALRAKNWKGAMRLANGALQKFKDSAVIQSFKAVALEKLGKTDEAFQVTPCLAPICENIRSVGTVDEQVLHTMGIIYKSMDRMDCLTDAYLKAVDLKKSDLDLMSGLFSCYIRECAFAKQQQLAMKMYKAASQSEQYLWWMIASLILQVLKGPSLKSAPPMGAEQTLKLAQSFIQKQLDTKKTLHSYEAMLLYIDLLYTQGHGDRVLELLESEMSESLCKQPLELKTLKAQCHLQQRSYEKAAAVMLEMLAEQPDNWTCLCLLLELYLPLQADEKEISWQTLCRETTQLNRNLRGPAVSSSDENKSVDLAKAEEVLNHVQKLLEEKSRESKIAPSLMRCSVLVEVEFFSRKHQNGLCEEQQFGEAILTAFKQDCSLSLLQLLRCSVRKMGHFKCTPIDLKPYILQLSGEGQEALAVALLSEKERLQRMVREDECTEMRDICCSLSSCYRILSTLSVPSLSPQTVSDLIRSCADLNGIQLADDRADFQDGAIRAAVQFLIAQVSEKEAPTEMGIPVWKAFLLLGIACEADPDNPYLSLAMAATCFLLGAPQLGLSTLEHLEIKNTQVDSVVSHFSFPFIQSYCCEEAARTVTLSAWQLFTHQKADVEETTLLAYTQGTYTKIPEFVKFKERLEMSHSFYLMKCESSIFSIAEMTSSSQQFETLLGNICQERPLHMATTDFFEELSFNEDLSIRPHWMPPTFGDNRLSVLEWWHSSFKDLHRWYEQETRQTEQWRESRVSWLKIRWCIPHLLRRMWLMKDADDTEAAIHTLLRETGTTNEEARPFLRQKLVEWNQDENKLKEVHTVYRYFQCSVFLSGHFAYGVLAADSPEETLNDFSQSLELVCEFCDQILGVAFAHLESDLSCWVQTASVTLGAMLSEELHYLVTALHFWKQRLEAIPKLAAVEKVKASLGSLSEKLQSFLERILHYLGLVNSMATQKIAQNTLLLVGAMQEKNGQTTFQDAMEDKDLTALAQFMEALDLDNFEKCSAWDISPSAEIDKMEGLLLAVFRENKKWARQLTQMAEKLLTTLQGLH